MYVCVKSKTEYGIFEGEEGVVDVVGVGREGVGEGERGSGRGRGGGLRNTCRCTNGDAVLSLQSFLQNWLPSQLLQKPLASLVIGAPSF